MLSTKIHSDPQFPETYQKWEEDIILEILLDLNSSKYK